MTSLNALRSQIDETFFFLSMAISMAVFAGVVRVHL